MLSNMCRIQIPFIHKEGETQPTQESLHADLGAHCVWKSHVEYINKWQIK
jgi:hypothetical protein